jgi:hypothetical protein
MVRARQVRVAAAIDAAEPDVAEQWEAWFFGVRQWLREQCLGLQPTAPRAPTSQEPE